MQTMPNTQSFSLDNFEGPLDFLLHLVQKNEIDIYEIPLKQITDQFLARLTSEISPATVDQGAEFIQLAATLLLLKSRMLLPKHELQEQPLEDLDTDPRFEIIHHLVEYCRFKDVAKILAEREEHQGGFYSRGFDERGDPQKFLGIEHLSLNDLAELFQQILSKAKSHFEVIYEEQWLISDKLQLIRQLLKEFKSVAFAQLFSLELSRAELIVTFLAVLELMKSGELYVIKENNQVFIKSYV